MEESAQIAAEYVASLENLPSEIRFILGEIRHKDNQVQSIMNRINAQQASMFKPPRGKDKTPSSWRAENPTVAAKIEEEFLRAKQLQEDKVALARRMQRLVHKSKGRLSHDLKKIARLTGESHAEEVTPSVLRTAGERAAAESFKATYATPSAPSPASERPSQKRRRLNTPVEKGPLLVTLPVRSRLSQQVHPSPLRKSATAPRSPEESEAEGEGEGGEEEEGDDDRIYCFCQKKSYGEMIGCDNENCRYQWFHLSCVGLKQGVSEKEQWYCPECSKKMSHTVGTEKRKAARKTR